MMMFSKVTNLFFNTLLAVLILIPSFTVDADTHTIRAEGINFEPQVTIINKGDTVHWTNMAGHSSTSVEDMIPSTAEMWDSAIGHDFEHTFQKEGLYLFKCKPHSSMGMSGVVIVGSPENLDAFKNEARSNSPFIKSINEAIADAEQL